MPKWGVLGDRYPVFLHQLPILWTPVGIPGQARNDYGRGRRLGKKLWVFRGLGLPDGFAVFKGQGDAAADGLAGEGRGLAEGEEVRRVDGPGGVRIDDREVGALAGVQAAGQPEGGARPGGQRLHHALRGDLAGEDQVGIEHRPGRLQPDDAHGAAREPAGLLLGAVRRVVRGHGVDGAVAQALDERLAVLGAAQRGIHLEAAVLLEVVLAKAEVVRSRLAGHAHPAGLGPADELHALSAGNVADVVAAAGLLGELQVALDLAPFALRANALVAVGGGVAAVVDIAAAQQLVVLAVRGDDHALAGGDLHGAAHHGVVLHAAAVVGKGAAAALQRGNVHGLEPPAAARDGGVGEDLDAGVAVDDLLLLGEGLGTVGYGVEVWHGADGGVAAVCGRKRPGADGLLITLAGLAEMDVDIDKAGGDPFPAAIDDLRAGGLDDVRPDGGDAAVADEYVRPAPACSVDQGPSFEQSVHLFHVFHPDAGHRREAFQQRERAFFLVCAEADFRLDELVFAQDGEPLDLLAQRLDGLLQHLVVRGGDGGGHLAVAHAGDEEVHDLETDDHQHGAEDTQLVHAAAHAQAHGARHPEAGRGGQAADVAVLHDDAGAQETEAAHHAGGDARGVELAGVRETVDGNGHKQGRAQRHEHVGPEAGTLAAQFALIADGRSEQGGSDQAER